MPFLAYFASSANISKNIDQKIILDESSECVDMIRHQNFEDCIRNVEVIARFVWEI